MMNKVAAIQKTNVKTNLAIKRLMETGLFANENKAFTILTAVMKALRDRLLIGEALDLGTQLPALLRGFYFEGWTLRSESKSRTKNAFLNDVRQHLKGGHKDLTLEFVSACLGVILDMIDQGEAVEVIHLLPKEIQDLCPDSSTLS